MCAKTRTWASASDAPTPWEQKSRDVAYRAALESIVLLENDGALPLICGKVALYGAGAGMTVKGGTGSGEVNERHSITIEEGLAQAGFQITSQRWLRRYEQLADRALKDYIKAFRRRLYRLNVTSIINFMNDPYCPPVGQPVTQKDVVESQTDTCIYVVARQAGEGADRKLDRNEYTLTEQERQAIAFCAEAYRKMILVINVGGVFDMSFLDEIEGINAVIFYAQQGGMGGAALADLLKGTVSPSGKLTDTWAKTYTDYPCAMEYSYLNGDLEQEYYKEGIYVGYRYFDSFDIAPRYPFGYGLSYTDFSIQPGQALTDRSHIRLKASVTNIGAHPGQEVVQLYASCPQSEKLPKEFQRLVAFEKTSLLQPGETQTVTLCFDAEVLASYRAADSVSVLERGDYILRLGNSSRWNTPCASILVEDDIILSQHDHICPRENMVQELTPPAIPNEILPAGLPRLTLRSVDVDTVRYSYRKPEAVLSPDAQKRFDRLSRKQLLTLTIGSGMTGKRHFDAPGAAGSTTSKLLRKGIPNVLLADGPAGVRLQKRSVRLPSGKIKPVDPGMALMEYLPGIVRFFMLAKPWQGKLLYQFTTAFPVELALAQTWNLPLLQEMGSAVGEEMKAYGVSYWLAPALNIHRNVLCGRNFEYYSEDPLLSGLMAAAVTRGVQSVPGHFVTLKHFACNNQEDNRNRTNANVNERALREIYLKGFEIAVRQSRPGAFMSSYNLVNGVYTANSYPLLTKVLRCEWGFEGFVMTDWYSTGKGLADNPLCLKYGNDLIMPGSGHCRRSIRRALADSKITWSDVRRCAANVFNGIEQTALAQQFHIEND